MPTLSEEIAELRLWVQNMNAESSRLLAEIRAAIVDMGRDRARLRADWAAHDQRLWEQINKLEARTVALGKETLELWRAVRESDHRLTELLAVLREK